jgi:retron-type reverse transcriptase
VGEPKSGEKPFRISKWLVWEAYQRVKANQGAPGVDGCSIEDFEADLGNNLYQIWNRMSSGSYFPPPVRAVEIPKSHGGVRILGVPQTFSPHCRARIEGGAGLADGVDLITE